LVSGDQNTCDESRRGFRAIFENKKSGDEKTKQSIYLDQALTKAHDFLEEGFYTITVAANVSKTFR